FGCVVTKWRYRATSARKAPSVGWDAEDSTVTRLPSASAFASGPSASSGDISSTVAELLAWPTSATNTTLVEASSPPNFFTETGRRSLRRPGRAARGSTPRRLNPKRLKALLTSLREAVAAVEGAGARDVDVDGDGNRASSSAATAAGGAGTAAAAFGVVLASELASRGVGITLPPSPGESDPTWFVTLMGSIVDVAGRVSIDDDAGGGTYPPPMMAALGAAMGMAASACASSLGDGDGGSYGDDGGGSPPLLLPTDPSVRKATDDAIGRCREVGDGRLYLLLKLAREASDGGSVRALKRQLNLMAYSNFLYGAWTFSPDQMPMARELSLFLSVGCVGAVEERLVHIRKEVDSGKAPNAEDEKGDKKRSKLEGRSTEELLRTYYLRRAPGFVELEDFSTTEQLLDEAKESLKDAGCPTDITADNCAAYLLHCYASAQLEYLREESQIWRDVQQQHRAMLNRRPEGGGGGIGIGGGISIGAKKKAPAKPDGTKLLSPTTAKGMEQEARSRAYAEARDGHANASYDALRDAVVAASLASSPSELEALAVMRDCYKLLLHQTKRLEAMALSAQRGEYGKRAKEDSLHGWKAGVAFVSPLLSDHIRSKSEDGSPPLAAPLRRLAERCAQTVVCASWMLEPLVGGGRTEDGPMYEELSALLPTAHFVLVACRSAAEGRESEEKMKSSALSQDARTYEEKEEALRLKCALAASTCRENVCKAINDEGEVSEESLSSTARHATVVAAKSSGGATNALFGAPYLQFLSAWSGLHLSAWPFCAVGQARAVVRSARESLAVSTKAWGRKSAIVERVLLDAGEADLEGGLPGGFGDKSESLYRRAMASAEEGGLEEYILQVLRVHCLVGLAKLALSNDASGAAETLVREALDALSAMDACEGVERLCLLCICPWTASWLSKLCRSYHVCVSRQIIADACLRSSRPEDARAFLTNAVKDSPGNFEAAFALASFHLRMVLGDEDDENGAKKARMLLLKSAKMDTSKPGPFSLLGVWYEYHADLSRSKGCYQKALGIEPSHPIAGRGLQRLMDGDELNRFCEVAAKQNSPFNGWAWRTLGQHKSREWGDDTTAAICFQQALRCRDIQVPQNETLGIFYSDPTRPSPVPGDHEASETWAELAACYRRLGKHSAALRAYDAAASSAPNGELPPEVLCAWARVELDLGLYEEAVEKCDGVLSSEEPAPHIRRMAAYIEGEALLFLARIYVQEGKFGASLSQLKRGVVRLSAFLPPGEKSEKGQYCVVKLLGDLYSSGNSLPSYVYSRDSSPDEKKDEGKRRLRPEIENQLAFIMEGEKAYSLALELAKHVDANEDDKYLVAASSVDLGTNLLSQARVLSMAMGEGSGGDTKTSLSDLCTKSGQIKDLISRSINAYLCAIDSSPHDAPAWCGLGCALIPVDPLMSQHAFSRALQIDPTLADSWSNIGLLYANHHNQKCTEVLDQLTQVEDTPLMWIGRGFMLENTSRTWNDQVSAREACMSKAADAYRAALQIMQHPSALLGLSLTCRRCDPNLQESNNYVYSALADRESKVESMMSLEIHQNLTGEGNIGASYVAGLSQAEEGLDRLKGCDRSESADLIANGKATMNQAKTQSEERGIELHTSEVAHCEIDLTVSSNVARVTAEFPCNLIDKVHERLPSISLLHPCEAPNEIGTGIGGLDEARNDVYMNPESGEAWLIFAKKLLQQINTKPDNTIALSQARTAAKKAFDLLHDRVVNATLLSPRRQDSHGSSTEFSDRSVVSHLPSASVLSEAMSLVSLLEEVESLKNQSNPSSLETTTIARVQESLLIDPTNSMAAAIIGIQ
ncbi:hypothetical protein ACHAWF_018923, partial [Thalassiosira exigua]